MRHADALVTETAEVLEQTAKRMRRLAKLLRRSGGRCLLGDYDALCRFADQASKTLEVGADVGTKLDTLMRALAPQEYV